MLSALSWWPASTVYLQYIAGGAVTLKSREVQAEDRGDTQTGTDIILNANILNFFCWVTPNWTLEAFHLYFKFSLEQIRERSRPLKREETWFPLCSTPFSWSQLWSRSLPWSWGLYATADGALRLCSLGVFTVPNISLAFPEVYRDELRWSKSFSGVSSLIIKALIINQAYLTNMNERDASTLCIFQMTNMKCGIFMF